MYRSGLYSYAVIQGDLIMGKIQKQLFTSFLFILFFSFSPIASSADLEFFDENFGDFAEELELAKEEGKQGIFLFFEMDECPFCHRMKTTILNKPEVVSFYKKHFKIFQVDIEGDVEMTDFQGNATTQKDFAFKKHRVRATPVMLFFDLQGKKLAKYTGPTSSAEEFLWLGEYVINGVHKEKSFTRYKRDKRNAQ